MNPAYKLVVDQPSDIHNSFTLVRNGISLPSMQTQELMPQQERTVGPAQPSMPLFGGNNNLYQNQQNQNSQFQTNNLRTQNINNNMNPNLINPTNNNIPDIFIN